MLAGIGLSRSKLIHMGVTMKTRKQIIDEILAQHKNHNAAEQAATLEFALKNMQDALLFSLAQDLNIDLGAETVRS